jgi:hypothetical protein
MKAWTILNWFIIESSGGLLWTQWGFGFHKMRGISWVAERLSVSRGLCFRDFVVWSSGYQCFGGTYCLHLQKRSCIYFLSPGDARCARQNLYCAIYDYIESTPQIGVKCVVYRWAFLVYFCDSKNRTCYLRVLWVVDLYSRYFIIATVCETPYSSSIGFVFLIFGITYLARILRHYES